MRCLAIGEKIYVACEDQSIKVFGTSGVEELGWSEDRPVLGMAAYENHLAVVVQSSIPWSGFLAPRIETLYLWFPSFHLESTYIILFLAALARIFLRR